jgi:hypothetical protein
VPGLPDVCDEQEVLAAEEVDIMRRTADIPVITGGKISRIDHDGQGRIAVLHVEEFGGARSEIRISYPEMPLDIEPHPEPVEITVHPMFRDQRPEVSVVRLA